jgi:CheY-like chemotaxis protein
MTARRILIVDDEEDIREVAQLTLEAVGGWEVLTAASGNEALAKAASQQPDAILLDIMMPDLDGLATFQKLQTNPVTQHIPVILLTAKVQAADRHRFAELGLTAMIVKPFDPMTLAERVADALGWSD